jgi:hypothetical protein
VKNSNNVQQRLAELFGLGEVSTVLAYKRQNPALHPDQYASLEEIPEGLHRVYLEIQGPDGETWVVAVRRNREGRSDPSKSAWTVCTTPRETYRTSKLMGGWWHHTFETVLPPRLLPYTVLKGL